jgi:hypothetical protein
MKIGNITTGTIVGGIMLLTALFCWSRQDNRPRENVNGESQARQGSASAQEMCVIADKEEYAVFVAVLFPNPPAIHLDGFHGNSYTIQDETTEESYQWKGDDRRMSDDFNRKGVHACRINREMFLSQVPEGARIVFISAEELRKTFSELSAEGRGWKEFRNSHPASSGVTYLSRPGFDANRKKAVMQVGHQADYEMGVGYRVYLEKSSKTGKWLITGAVLTRRS